MRQKHKQVIRYEDNAEQRTVSGWCCKTCDRFWGSDEHMARWCCANDLPCNKCDGRTEKPYTHCNGCRDLLDYDRFQNLEAKPYDGSAVVTYRDDRYFFDEDELLEYMADVLSETPDADFMLVFAECRKPRWERCISEMLQDDLCEDSEWDTSEIDEQISSWVDANAPSVYWPTNVRVDTDSIAKLIEEAKA